VVLVTNTHTTPRKGESIILTFSTARPVGRSDCCKQIPPLHVPWPSSASARAPFIILCLAVDFLTHFTSMTIMPIIMSMMLNVSTFQFLNIVVTSVQNQHVTLQEFYEHFKYDVISSSLLSSSITAPSSTRRRSSPSPDDLSSDDPEPNLTTSHPPPPPGPPVINRSRALSLLLLCLCPISLYLDYFMLYVLIGTALYYFGSYTIASGRLPDFIPSVGASYFNPTLC
jgi:hypothetical protein